MRSWLAGMVIAVVCLVSVVCIGGGVTNWNYNTSDLIGSLSLESYVDTMYRGTSGYLVTYDSDGNWSEVARGTVWTNTLVTGLSFDGTNILITTKQVVYDGLKLTLGSASTVTNSY